eukprot:gene4520-7001_t
MRKVASSASLVGKVIVVVDQTSKAEESFRICAGESGDDVRAAVRGAFGLPFDMPFTVRDGFGCNIVLGFPSVLHGATYQLHRRPTAGSTPNLPPDDELPPASKQVFPTAAAAAPPAARRDQEREYQVSVQPSAGAQGVETVRHIASAREPHAGVPPSGRHAHTRTASPNASGRGAIIRYQELSTAKPPAKEYIPGGKNKKHSSMVPMPGAAKALLIGASYTGQKEALDTPAGDVKAMRAFLIDAGFHGQQLVLTDEKQANAVHVPTKDNMLRAMDWLVADAKAGETLFLHFSGHGVEVRDDQREGTYNEALLPVNFRSTKPFQILRADHLTDLLVTKLPHGVRLVIVCDCAHSGSMVTLPFSLRATKDGNLELREKLGYPEVSADVVMLSGWRGDQTADSTRNALTPAFIQAMSKDTNPTFEALLLEVRNTLYQRSGAGYQVPQISTSKPMRFMD